MSRPSLRAAIDAKCRDCGGQEGGARYWRLHTSACPVTDCPLWSARPIASRNAPEWLASREPSDLPRGFRSLSSQSAIALIRCAGGVLLPKTGNNSSAKQQLARKEHAERIEADAALQSGPKCERLEGKLLDLIRAATWIGMTIDELAVGLEVQQQLIDPCMKELECNGLIRDSGQRRPDRVYEPVIVWVAT